MTTLNSTSVLASIIAQNPYHIISIQGQMPMSHAQNTNHLSCKNSNITRITSTRKNMPKSLITTLTSSKNRKLFTLSPKKPLTF